MNINLYDFDKTIYDGDSSLDFYKFCFKKKKSIAKYWLKQATYLILYFLHLKNKKQVKEVFFIFLKDFNDIDNIIKEFWDNNFYKIKKWYINKNHDNDIIISASPEFLLKIPCKRLKIYDLIATQVDIKSGKFLSENCYGKEKVNRLLLKYSEAIVNEAYSDSLSDMPIIMLSKRGYLVNKNKIECIHNLDEKVSYYN